MTIRQRTFMTSVVVMALLTSCSGSASQTGRQTGRQILQFLRTYGDDSVKVMDDVALDQQAARSVQAAQRIQSVDDLARIGGTTYHSELDATRSHIRPLVDDMTVDIRRLADESGAYPSDVFPVLQDAHCKGLKKEIETGQSASEFDYLVFLFVAGIESQLPQPPLEQLKEHVDDLLNLAKLVRDMVGNDEVAYRAYIAEACNL